MITSDFFLTMSDFFLTQMYVTLERRQMPSDVSAIETYQRSDVSGAITTRS